MLKLDKEIVDQLVAESLAKTVKVDTKSINKSANQLN